MARQTKFQDFMPEVLYLAHIENILAQEWLQEFCFMEYRKIPMDPVATLSEHQVLNTYDIYAKHNRFVSKN